MMNIAIKLRTSLIIIIIIITTTTITTVENTKYINNSKNIINPNYKISQTRKPHTSNS
jgi:hypothetical protein